MLFSRQTNRATRSRYHVVAAIRDIVEVAAIVIAAVWALYVFAYENHIKPAMAAPNVDVKASMQRLSERNGLIAVGLNLQLHNVGTVRVYFLALAVNVYGERITPGTPPVATRNPGVKYEFTGFYHPGPLVPVYSWAIVTSLGDPSTGQSTFLSPGNTINVYRIFYVPQGRFDELLLGFDGPLTKDDSAVIPTHLTVASGGAVRVRSAKSSKIEGFNVMPVTSLDIR